MLPQEFFMLFSGSFMERKKIAGIILAGITAVYVFGAIVFTGRFQFRTYVDGYSLTMQTPSDATISLLQQTDNTKLKIIRQNGTIETVPFKRLGIYRNSDDMLRDVALNSWKWPLSLFHRTDYCSDKTWLYTRDNIRKGLSKIYAVSSDAGSDDAGLTISEETDGVRVDTDKLLNVICKHLDENNLTIDLAKEGCYQVMSGDDEMLDAEIPSYDLDKVKDARIHLNLNNQIKENVPSDFGQECLYKKNGRYFIDFTKCREYAEQLAAKYDTYGKDRTFHTSSGDNITISQRSSDTFLGFKMDSYQLASDIEKKLVEGGSSRIDVPWTSRGMTLTGSDIGDTYFEVSIETQHVWLYVDGVCVEDADTVTGFDKKGYKTPKGLFYVRSLNRDYTMHYPEGSSHCDYFIMVTPDGVGIHDAKRRGNNFGGNIYKWDGSHGCINMPYDAEVVFFKTLEKLDNSAIPVVIY